MRCLNKRQIKTEVFCLKSHRHGQLWWKLAEVSQAACLPSYWSSSSFQSGGTERGKRPFLHTWLPKQLSVFQYLFFLPELVFDKGLGRGGGEAKRKTLKGNKERDSSLTAKSITCITWGMRWEIIFTLWVDFAFCIWDPESDIIQLFNTGMPLCYSRKTWFCSFQVSWPVEYSLALKSKSQYFLSQLTVNKMLSVLKVCQRASRMA